MTKMKILILLTIFSIITFGISEKSEWWKSMSLYQIYPRSFMDSDGDGVGDLKGIQSKLQYLVDLKVDAVWLSPIYQSPMVDFGYDISDFKAIDPIFGTMEDFDNLLSETHKLGLKLILDFVPNHSSDKHDWFLKSVDKIEPYTDYYIWHEGIMVNGTRQPPNNWLSAFHGSAWQWNDKRGAYYYHLFTPEQPDFNYRNPLLVKEIENILRFWLDKGVDGFRVDYVVSLFEFEDLRDEPLSGVVKDPRHYHYLIHDYTLVLNECYDVVRQWRNLLDEYDSRILMLETWSNTSSLIKYYKAGATFPFNFGFIQTLSNKSSAQEFKDLIDIWTKKMPEGAVANWVIGNHDSSRLFSRFGDDFGQAIMIMAQLLPGVAVTYYGEEIGMKDTHISWNQIVDPQAKNVGIELYEAYSRDKARTPMQWNNSTSAGFSVNPNTWLPVDESFKKLNVEAQKIANNSILKSFLKITSLREWPAVRSGSLDTELVNDELLLLSREMKGEKSVYVLVNFRNSSQSVNLESFKKVPANLKLYHVTNDTEVGKTIKSSYLDVPGRGATIFVSVDKSASS